MRLVKALRRRIGPGRAPFLVVVGALGTLGALGSVGCLDQCATAVTASSSSSSSSSSSTDVHARDCEPTIRLPDAPRIMEVRDDGSLHAGPACATANCMAGAPGAWGYRDATSTKIEVGGHRIELAAAPDGAKPSRFAAKPALRGFLVGHETAVIDRGAEIDVVTPTSVEQLPMPELVDNEIVTAVVRDSEHAGVFLSVRGGKRSNTGSRSRVIALATDPSTPPPSDDATVIHDFNGPIVRRVGWLLPTRDGAAATIQRVAGEAIPLSVEVPPRAWASFAAGRYILEKERRQLILDDKGALVVELPHGMFTHAHGDVLYAVDVRAPGAFHVVERAGAEPLRPLFAPRPGFDIAGAALPEGTRIERLEIALRGTRALVIERRRLPTCTVEDRLVLVDLTQPSARLLAGGDVVRLHPMWAGDRFRYVEADPIYESH